MSLIKAFCVAFSIYSKIPMPRFEWKEEELRLHLIFFPFVGGVIGLLVSMWYFIHNRCAYNQLTYMLIGTAIPLIITGGFHVDGYMDTMDACKSYKSKEEKLQILKDPHIGAFSVIMLAVAGLLYMGAYSGISGNRILVFSLGFVVSRIFSAIAVICFPKAKKDGMLSLFSDSCRNTKNIVLLILAIELAASIAAAIAIDVVCAIAMIGTALLTFAYYYYKSRREFGGVTGDAAGYYVTITEIAIALVLCCICNL